MIIINNDKVVLKVWKYCILLYITQRDTKHTKTTWNYLLLTDNYSTWRKVRTVHWTVSQYQSSVLHCFTNTKRKYILQSRVVKEHYIKRTKPTSFQSSSNTRKALFCWVGRWISWGNILYLNVSTASLPFNCCETRKNLRANILETYSVYSSFTTFVRNIFRCKFGQRSKLIFKQSVRHSCQISTKTETTRRLFEIFFSTKFYVTPFISSRIITNIHTDGQTSASRRCDSAYRRVQLLLLLERMLQTAFAECGACFQREA